MNFAYLKNVVVAVVLCSIPTAVFAQQDPKTEARAHFDRGLILAKGLAYAEAVAEFNRAYQLSPNYAVMFNLGQAYIGMGQPVYAIEALTRYLNEGGKEVTPARRKEVESDIARQERRIATVTLRSQFSGAVVWLDGVEVGKLPLPAPLRASAGPHVLAASLAGYRPFEQRLELAGKEQRIVDLAFEPMVATAPANPTTTPAATTTAPSVAPVTTSPVPSAAPASPATPADLAATTAATTPSLPPVASGSKKTAAYVVGGLGLASLVAGGVFGIRAITKENDSEKLCPKDQCSQPGVDLNNQAKTAALVADITIGAGLVGIAVATYLFVRSPKGDTSTPGSLAYGIRLAPEVGPGVAGVALGGQW